MANCTEFVARHLRRVLFSLIILIAIGQLLDEVIYIYEYPKWKVGEVNEMQKTENENRFNVENSDRALDSNQPQYSPRISTAMPAHPAKYSPRISTAMPAHPAQYSPRISTAMPAHPAKYSTRISTAMPAHPAKYSTRISTAIPADAAKYSTRISTAMPDAPRTTFPQQLTTTLSQIEGLMSKECQLVLYGTNEDIENERKKNETYLDVGDEALPWKDAIDDEDVLQIADDCQVLKQKYKFIGEKINSTQQELEMPLAYSIVVHEDSHQLSTLLAAIYREHNIYCIHVDKKSSSEFKKAVNAVTSCFPNIFRSSKSQDVVYASIERVLADINCIDDLLKFSHDWKYMINLCGQDFPLLTNGEIVKQLDELKGTSFIHEDLHPMEHVLNRSAFKFEVVLSDDGTTKRLQKTNIPHEPPPYNLTITKNLAYNIFAREFLQWAFVDGDVGRTLIEWSRDTYSPDEHFWILLNNHPDAPASSQHYGYDIVRKIRWVNFNQTCHGYYRHGICIFGAGDLKGLVQPDTVALFANKFYLSRDSVAVQCLRQQLDERSLLSQEERPRNPDKIPLKIRLYKRSNQKLL